MAALGFDVNIDNLLANEVEVLLDLDSNFHQKYLLTLSCCIDFAR